MTCCVAINSKERDCLRKLFNYVFSLMLHKCIHKYIDVTQRFNPTQSQSVYVEISQALKKTPVSAK